MLVQPAIPFPDEQIKYREIPYFPGYLAGADGSIWSRWHRGRGPRQMRNRWHRLTPNPCGGPRKQSRRVTLYLNGKRCHLAIGRLVLLAFDGPCPEGMECCHKDGDPCNNRHDNLRWDTHVENMRDASRQGRLKRKTRSNLAVLFEADVRKIRIRLAANEEPRVIAKDFRVTTDTITDIRDKKSWKWVE